MTSEGDQMLTPPEAAKIVGCGRNTIRRACALGQLKAVRAGGVWIIRRADLDTWLAEGHYKPNMARHYPRLPRHRAEGEG